VTRGAAEHVAVLIVDLALEQPCPPEIQFRRCTAVAKLAGRIEEEFSLFPDTSLKTSAKGRPYASSRMNASRT
jgi:hypothetical protein